MIINKSPLVSVVVITYKSSEFVLETLESIKNQTHENIELIISDDHSNDNTVRICKDWLKKHSQRFAQSKIITADKNEGIPANCNRGVEACTGEWIKIIAGDDLLTTDCIRENLNFASQDTSRLIIISEMDAFLDGTKPMQILERKKPFGNVFTSHHTSENQNDLLVQASYFGNAPTLFYNKEVFNKISFDETIPLLEDYPLAIRATKEGFKFEYMPIMTVLYRVRQDSAYFKNETQLFGNFYKTKQQFDKKYRHSNLDFLTLNNELFYYKTHLFFDKHNLNKNTLIYRIAFKVAITANPYRYVVFFKRKIKKI